MPLRLTLLCALCASLSLTACGRGAPQSVRTGPQTQPPVTPGPNNQAATTYTAPAGVISCPDGTALVTTDAGVSTCV